ncbi:MAG: family 78 glycoside hydrolase catalytic domain [Proteobacteria bacterium]|nr:family 78 glycoside hydrolase catalytic domain [Pseudomonadota bacterium]
MSFTRRAEFIWRPRGLGREGFWTAPPRLPGETNRFVMFRRRFDVSGPVESAPVVVTADGRYQLFINGVLIGRGPARSASAQAVLDPYDLAPWLTPGPNVIAVLAHSYGRNTAWYELPGWDPARAFGCGGFFLQGEVVTAGASIRLDTDSQWRCRVAEAWRTEVPSNSLGFSEWYDARQADERWRDSAYDDTSWDSAEVLRVAGRNYSGDVVPFQFLSLRDIPAQHHGPTLSARPIAVFETAPSAESDDLAARMNGEALLPLGTCSVGEGRDRIVTVGERCVSVIYDFGEVVTGYIGFELDGPAGAVVDFYPGEQLLPDGRVLIYDGIPGFDAPIAHRYVLRAGAQSWERFEWNGLRYLQVSYRQCQEPLQVRTVTVHQCHYPVEERGQFECSDPALNRIWAAGARTLRLCMHDAYVDCPSREQRQWMDAYLDARINYATYGDTRLAARLIRQLAASQRPEGLTTMAAPGDFALAGMTNIPDFCLYWILAIGDYLRFADDPELAEEVYPNIARALQWFERYLDVDGLLSEVPLWVFVEWAETDKKGQVTAFNALYVAALRTAARLARAVRHEPAAEKYQGLADRVAVAINALLWDETRGVYADARRHGRLSRRVSQQSNAAVIAWEIAPRERWPRMFETVLDEERLVLTHGLGREGQVTHFDEENQVVMAQPFYSHFLHRALRLDGRFETLVDNIRRRWSVLLADGESTFRETWQLEPITSKCHAWSATPTFDLSTDVLGVSPIADGFRRLRIAPQIAGLAWARGRYPTPHGDVAVQWRKDSDGLKLTVVIPPDCEAEVVCPGTTGPVTVAAGEHEFVEGTKQE